MASEARTGRPRRWLRILKPVISIGLTGWIVHTVLSREGVDMLGARLMDLSVPWLLTAALVQAVAVGVSVARWRLLLRAEGMDLPVPWLLRTFLAGRFVGVFTPSTAGLDVYRAVEVGRITGRRASASSVILVEKMVGLLSLGLVTLALLPAGMARHAGGAAVVTAVVLAALSVLGLLVLRDPSRVEGILGLLPTGLRTRVARLLSSLRAGGLSRGLLTRTAFLGVISHLLTASVFVCASVALGLDVSAWHVLVVGNAIILATLLPISIGGVGVREGVAVMLLAGVGVGAGDAVLVAVVGYLATQPPALLGGILLAWPQGLGPERLAVSAGTETR